jgi:predicted transcriptional regulator
MVEGINVKGLLQSRLAKSISDSGWSRFLTLFKYKIDELDTIQYEPNKLEIDLWYAEAELYDAKNKEDKKAAKENVNKMKKRIEELENRIKQILKVLDRITKKFVANYLII